MAQSELVLSDIFRRSFLRYADRIAVAADDKRLTYSELRGKAQALAEELQNRGIGPGDAVVLLMRNSVDFVIADIAIVMLGACKVPLNDMLSADDIDYMVGHADAKAIIAHSSFAATLAATHAVTSRECVKIAIADDGSQLAEFTVWTMRSAPEESDWPSAQSIASTHRGLIIYTGGTTGRPKGVLHTQQGLLLNMLSHQINLGLQEDERLLVCSPLPHSAQLLAAATLLRGGMVWIERAFDAAKVLDAIERERLTLTFMVPTMIYRLLDHPAMANTDIGSIRTIVYGASPITPTRLKQAIDRFGPVLLQIYGQTEVPNLITTLSKSDHLLDEFRASCGQPVQFVDVVVRDEGGVPLAIGEVGEVTVRSHYALHCYHDDEERTDEAFVGDFLKTGDIGYLDSTGHLYLVDRAKDMIISGGFNVYSTEVENVIQQYDLVQQVTVIGIPDDQWGEAVTAFVVPKGDNFEVSVALDLCREKLARYKVPKSIRLVEAIPLTSYGKPDKKTMRSQYWGNAERQVN